MFRRRARKSPLRDGRPPLPPVVTEAHPETPPPRGGFLPREIIEPIHVHLRAERRRRERIVNLFDQLVVVDENTVQLRHPTSGGLIGFSTPGGVIEHIRWLVGDDSARPGSQLVIDFADRLDAVVEGGSGDDPPVTRLEVIADEVRRHIEELGWVPGSDVTVRVVHSRHA